MGTNPLRENTFRFKQFSVRNSLAAMKVGTDGVLLGAWADADGCRTVLDVGTGCGLIALMLAQRYPTVTLTAIDIVDEAVAEARENFMASPWAERLTADKADFNNFNPLKGAFDLIVSNPPFFTTTLHSPDSAREAARHGVNLTPASMLTLSRPLLADNGRLCMITPADMRDELEFQSRLNGMYPSRRVDVRTKATAPARRTLWEFRPGDGPTAADELLLGSDASRSLTAPFYLH